VTRLPQAPHRESLHTTPRISLYLAAALLFHVACAGVASAQTTGQIAGVVKDESGGVIPGANVAVVRMATGENRSVTTDSTGSFAVPLLSPGLYDVRVTAPGFKTHLFPSVAVNLAETTTVNPVLAVGDVTAAISVNATPPLVQRAGPQLGRVVDSRGVTALPLATRNFTQILGLSPGTATYLPDSTGVGRNTQAISVNGARVTQNGYQINGIDATTMGTNGPILVAVPAPETIQEFKVQTSLYDASIGRAGGGSINLITRSGTNDAHGVLYYFLRNDVLNANNPFLKAAGVERPVLDRHVLGGALGGPLRRDRMFFFGSYQGARETNGASIINSVSSNVLVAPGLTDERSVQTLQSTFGVTPIHPSALALLNARLPNGRFVIPTPQSNGLYTASTPSTFREDQFNGNLDTRIGQINSLAVKFFFGNTSQFLALPSFRGTGPNVEGFGTDQTANNRVLAIQNVHAFSATFFNEARIGYAVNSVNTIPQEPVTDTQVGIMRSNAEELPGLPLIRIAPAAGGVITGTPTNISPARPSVVTMANTVTLQRGRHGIRFGAEIRYNKVDFTTNQFTRGQIDFDDFNSFLKGTTQVTTFGSGIVDGSQRAWDYNFFAQDDWRFSPSLTLNLGIRYELDLPVFEARGRAATFDPSLYQPRIMTISGVPAGPPEGGLVQAGNVIPGNDLPNVPNAGKYVVRSIDPNNLAPRLGFVYSPPNTTRLVVRGGYGVAHSRATFQYVSQAATLAPNYILGVRNDQPLNDPFFPVPSQNQFPTLVPGVALAGPAFDRNLRTPYIHQFNLGAQYEFAWDSVIEVAYVGTRGRQLFRQVAINQARLASPEAPIRNEVTGAVITTNTPANANVRAPFQGVSITGFSLNQTTGESSYDSLQLSLTKRYSHGLQLLAAYTFAKSIDDASGTGGGAGIVGIVNTGAVGDSSPILGNQADRRGNRGVSDFDRTHRFVLSFLWDLSTPAFAAGHTAGRHFLGGWSLSGILTAMSGLPIDVVDTGAGSLYGLNGGTSPLARPSVATGATCESALQSVQAGFYFNPFVFVRPIVPAGQVIPSSGGTAAAGAVGTDVGTVGRNCLRGPRQVNTDLAVHKVIGRWESRSIEFRAEFFNLFNQVNFANPLSNLNAVRGTGGSINPDTGQLVAPGNFGRIVSLSSNPRIVQLAVKFTF